MKKNDVFSVRITGTSQDGSGVGRADGIAVFAPGCVVGDVAELRIIKLLSNRAIARVERIIEPSADRISSDCDAYPACGGCDFRCLSYEAELRLKHGFISDALKRIGGIEPPPFAVTPSPRTDHYRNKAIYPLFADRGGIGFGFYRKNSHICVRCGDCAIHPQVFGSIMREFCRWAESSGNPVYNEETGSGCLRSVFIRRAENTGEIMVCPVASRIPAGADRLAELLTANFPEIKSVMLSLNSDKTNRLLGSDLRVLAGSPEITELICGVRLRLSPLTFCQVNTGAAELLYAATGELLFGECIRPRLLDLYCGAGSIGLTLASRCESVTGLEIVPAAVENARRNARENSIENASFICADAADVFSAAGTGYDAVVVDPPRKGLDAHTADYLLSCGASTVIYVSCEPATLARDLARLSGTYTLKALRAFDLFPRTANVETVVQLVLRNPATHINIDVDVEEMVQDKRGQATYPQIKAYVLEHSGLKVSSLYIAQVKKKHGIIERENYNKSKSENATQPQCPPEKEKAITDALKHFGMMTD